MHLYTIQSPKVTKRVKKTFEVIRLFQLIYFVLTHLKNVEYLPTVLCRLPSDLIDCFSLSFPHGPMGSAGRQPMADALHFPDSVGDSFMEGNYLDS